MKKIISLLLVAGIAFVSGCGKSDSSNSGSTTPDGGKKITVALMPKSKGNAYFISCKKGADKAAKELGVDLVFDGPTDPDPAKQNEIVENWITLGVDAIAVACENREGISTALRKAKAKGIKVITYDADALPDTKVFHAGTAIKHEQVVNTGGRVLGITALGDTIAEAKQNAYAAVNKIQWQGGWCRSDISDKA